jgi:hypothetical protein
MALPYCRNGPNSQTESLGTKVAKNSNKEKHPSPKEEARPLTLREEMMLGK